MKGIFWRKGKGFINEGQKKFFHQFFNKVEAIIKHLTNKHMISKFEGGGSPEKEKGYPADFVAKVKAEFSDRDKLHQALDAGSDIVSLF
ncbi:MAG: hypothetical protein AAB397_03615 [Patescibacteria group bacterium]